MKRLVIAGLCLQVFAFSCSKNNLKDTKGKPQPTVEESAEDASLATEPVMFAGSFLTCSYLADTDPKEGLVACDIRNQENFFKIRYEKQIDPLKAPLRGTVHTMDPREQHKDH